MWSRPVAPGGGGGEPSRPSEGIQTDVVIGARSQRPASLHCDNDELSKFGRLYIADRAVRSHLVVVDHSRCDQSTNGSSSFVRFMYAGYCSGNCSIMIFSSRRALYMK